MSDNEKPRIEKKSRLKLKKKIKFEKEVVSKDEAQKLLQKSNEKHRQKPPKKPKKTHLPEEDSIENTTTLNGTQLVLKDKKKRAKENNVVESNTENIESPKKKKKSKSAEPNSVEDVSEVGDTGELDPANPQAEKTESIRARKRKRHQQLLEDKKLKSELNLQQKCLNYLSQWKHSNSTWKFEKLKQVWIQQNMFNEAKIPDEIWNTVVEYFDGAKGKIKSTIMSDALKIIEGTNSEENGEESDDIKYKRARYIIQNLQE